jgi:hypothetical protein
VEQEGPVRRIAILCGLCLALFGAGASAAPLKSSSSIASTLIRQDAAHQRRASQTHVVLLGDQAIEPTVGQDLMGSVEAFAFRARRRGTATSISVYLDARDRATTLFAGLYSSRDSHPQSLLTSGLVRSPKAAAWNTVRVGSTHLMSGRTYWLAVLGKGGAIFFRDRSRRSCTAEGSSNRSLQSFPRTWTGGRSSHVCLISAYVKGTSTGGGTKIFGTNVPGGTTAIGTAGTTLTTLAPGSLTLAPVAAAGPTISGSPVIGQTLVTSTGSWLNAPTSYGYQWEDCNSSGSSCVSAAGSASGVGASGASCTNPGTGCTYTIVSGEATAPCPYASGGAGACTIGVIVTAINPAGSTRAAATVVGPVSSGGGGNGVGGGSCVNATNHPAAFPNNCNTGYANAPGYSGQLTSCSSSIQSNTTYQFCDYPNGLTIGNASNHPANVTFIGCRFASNSQADADVADYGTNVTFSYSTFEPSAVSAPPVAHTQGYQYAIDQDYASGGFTVDHSDFWGWANGIQIDHSSQSTPVSVTYSWFHDARADGGVDHTDAILENYGDPGVDYMTFSHNTIASVGNTNGLALQDGRGGGYDHLTVTDNYFAGFGYTVNLGGSGPVTNTQFTGNVFGSDFPIAFGPLYGGHWTTGNGNTWSGNTYYTFPGTTWLNPAINGRYWWPSDIFGTQNGQKPATFAAHTTDYSG